MIGRGFVSVIAAIFGLCVVLGTGAVVLIYAENTPLPDSWNPSIPLDVTDPQTALTKWKFTRALAEGASCRAALATAADFSPLIDKIDSPKCGIKDQVALRALAGSRVKPINTRCQTALRWAMWTQHGLQPVARELFDQDIRETLHFSSYSCRQIRTTNGRDGRMSTHATAEAIDISGFVLKDGTSISLLRDWDQPGPKSQFLRRAKSSACTWFRLTLSPDYNALHADHFHLQHTGWGLCR